MKKGNMYTTEEINIPPHVIKERGPKEPAVSAYTAMDKLKVGIVGMSPHAGASFLAACLAKFLGLAGNHPAVVELGPGHLYDSLGMDKHFAGREYCKFFGGAEKGASLRGKGNIEDGINWVLKSPEEWKVHLNGMQKLGLINAVGGNVILCDISCEDEDCFQLLQYMDKVIVVIDPLPSKMLSGYGFLQSLKALNSPGKTNLYVINKYNRGINRRELADFVKVEKPVYLPMIKQETIYALEYSCRNPYGLPEVKMILEKPLREIATRLYQ